MVDVLDREHGAEEGSVIACDEKHKKEVGIHYIDDQMVRTVREEERYRPLISSTAQDTEENCQ